MDRIQRLVASFREDPVGTAILVAVLLALGIIARQLTHAGIRHKRQHPDGLNSGPDTPLSILSTDEEKR